ncbi:MAG: replicative DNA helicase [Planctomycetaceae bacterium]|nr:replicative DNA helicase [Planctomycetaceae bacterium]
MANESRGDIGGKLPPQDLEAERCVLGSILLHNDAIDDVLQHVRVDCFYADPHRRMFSAIQDLYESGTRGIDPVTLGHELQRRNELAEIGGTPYIVQIIETVPHAAHAEYYARIVYDKWMQRTLIDACTDTLRDAYHGQDEVDELVAKAERRIFEIAERQQNIDKFALKDILKDTFDRIYSRMDQEGTLSGVHTGFTGLDEMTSGFQAAELLVLAARPSMGKTALVCNFALAVAGAGCGALIFSLEQSNLELAERFLAIEAKVNGHKLRQGDLDEVEQYSLDQASLKLREYPMFIDDTAGRTVSQIAAVSRRLKRRHPELGLIIIDYLQLIESEETTNRSITREQQISTITRRLKFLAKDLQVPVIALAQLNRGVEQREDKRPRLADLRESGAIEQDADLVMFLHRPEAYDPEDRPGEADLIVAKNRNGPIGTVPLVWLREQLRFGDRSPLAVPDGVGDW